MKLGVTVATYRRPKGLDRLLSSIAEAEVPKGAELLVVVVDNDPEGSSRDIVDQYASLLETHYEIEPERGIPFVRNRGVRAALDLGATHILFVDDDERVDEQWLVGIASARARLDAPIIAGTIISEFEEDPPRWAIDSGAFQRRIREDGASIDFATTANSMVDAELLAGRPGPFDTRLRYSGGSDLQLFAELHNEGHQIRCTTAATTYELYPQSRVTKEWLLKRQRRRGTNRSTTLRLTGGGPSRYAKRIVAGCYEMLAGLAQTARGWVGRDEVGRLKGRMRFMYGVGMLAGLFGARVDEYRTHHGS
ncbi:MAG: glycosyltransferase [Acidimicrobiales bacterium]|nr:glycosyltransferase [Acidimicrobiales bacterium]